MEQETERERDIRRGVGVECIPYSPWIWPYTDLTVFIVTCRRLHWNAFVPRSKCVTSCKNCITNRVWFVRFLVPMSNWGRRLRRLRLMINNPDCTFGRNLQPRSRCFQSGLNLVANQTWARMPYCITVAANCMPSSFCHIMKQLKEQFYHIFLTNAVVTVI